MYLIKYSTIYFSNKHCKEIILVFKKYIVLSIIALSFSQSIYGLEMRNLGVHVGSALDKYPELKYLAWNFSIQSATAGFNGSSANKLQKLLRKENGSFGESMCKEYAEKYPDNVIYYGIDNVSIAFSYYNANRKIGQEAVASFQFFCAY